MKFIHLSDLHLGKHLNEFSMLEDQRYILTRIINIIDDESPQCVLIAGDVYDKAVPSAEAVQLFDDFLVRLSQRGLQVFIISGNHDSPERMSFGSRLMELSGVHIAPVYGGSVRAFTLMDSYGEVDIFLLPFVKPVHVRRFFSEQTIDSYTDALRVAVDNMPLDPARRNILVAHLFATGAVNGGSEEISIGGADNVDVTVFDRFDYVALGHIHRAQQIVRETVRYCGTPLKYSFSEADNKKSVTVVELAEKGNISVRLVPLIAQRDLCRMRGSYMQLTSRDYYCDLVTSAYMHITLTDEDDIPDAIGKLRVIYPNIMKLEYDNSRTRSAAEIAGPCDADSKSPLELFSELFERQNNRPMSVEQSDLVEKMIEDIWEGNV